MQNKRYKIFKKTFLLLALIIGQVTYARVDEVIESNTGLDLTNDFSVSSYPHFGILINPITWPENFVIKEVKNEIIFGIDQNMAQIDAAYGYKVVFDLDVKELSGIALVTNTTNDIELEIDYDPNGAYQDKELYSFTGGIAVDVRNIRLYKKDMTGTYVLTTIDRENLFLSAKAESKIYIDFDYSVTPLGVMSTSIDGTDILVSWSDVVGAEAYDLEWTWVNRYKGTVDGGTIDLLDEDQVSYDFKNNASRIRVKENTYRIPMIYGDGYILTRYRAVGRDVGNCTADIDGLWMTGTVSNGLVSDYSFPGCKITVDAYEDNAMNYGASMTFVEDGKRNTGITYMDGVMKRRQSISQLNSQDELIVGSTLYDYYGRPAIGVMGSPVKQTQLGYVDDLNMLNASIPYDKEYFHSDAFLLGDCGPTAALPMDPQHSKGSANYYSSQNDNKEGAEAFVPEANGYNFSQIHYTNDMTGRVKRAGGVGVDHQLGVAGHYTETIFTTAEGDEVDELLGSEAADVVNYTKVITRDVHGQVSVAIIDNMGRTVISYLEGSAPDGLEAIEGNGPETLIDVDLIGLTSESEELLGQGILQVQKKIAVADPNQIYTFNYDFTSLSFSDCLPPDVCFDCIYEIEFKVTPAEGEFTDLCPLKNGADEVTGDSWTHTVGDIASFDIDCDDPIQFSSVHDPTFTLKFPRFGEYYVTKTLKVAHAPIEYYWEEYVANADESCIIPYSTFLSEAMMNIDFGDCYDGNPCELGFLYESGSLEEYLIANPGSDEATYNNLREDFIDNCQNQPICAQMRPILLADVSPGGQYGDVSGASGLSVFNSADPMTYSWRDVTFLDTDGDPSTTTNGLGDVVAVNHSSISLTEFVTLWQNHWAETLLGAHPEYQTYSFCEAAAYVPLFDYALDFKLTETYAEALAAGYLVPVDPDDYATTFGGAPVLFTTGDPLVNEIESGALAVMLNTPMYIYDDTYPFGIGNKYKEVALNILGTSMGATLYQIASEMTDGVPFGSSTCDLDAHWIAFRDLYLGRRNLILQVVMEGYGIQTTVGGGGYIRCINNDVPFCAGSPYGSKQKRFMPFDQVMNYPLVLLLSGDDDALADMAGDAAVDVEEFCASTCESMAASWMLELEGCAVDMGMPGGQIWGEGDTPDHDFYNTIKADLIAVCKGGCSPEYPIPSQYHLAPPTARLTSFQTVLEYYLPGVADNETISCNHYLVDFPSAVKKTSLINTLNDCGCDKLMSVDNEIDFEDDFGFVPVDFCKDRTACANAKATINIDNIYPLESISWFAAEIATLESTVTFTDYGCDGDGCIDCSEMDQAIIDFQSAFPGASIEEDAVMFTSFVNEQHGTYFDYYSLITFIENCDSLTEGGIITEGFTPITIDFINFLNEMIDGEGLLENSTVDNDLFPSFLDEISPCPGDGTGAINYTVNNTGDAVSFFLNNFTSGSSGFNCTSCLQQSLFFYPDPLSLDVSPYAGSPEIANDNILGFEGIYATFADLDEYPSVYKFHVTTGVTNPDGGDPILIEYQFETNCFDAFEIQNELCDNYIIAIEDDCEDALIASAELEAEAAYGEYLAAKKEEFVADYIETCRQVEETYDYNYQANRYHYTLAYYDRAGNLAKTVPPKGVKKLGDVGGLTAIQITELQAFRADDGGAPHYPGHKMVTNYTYNGLNQPVTNTTPDGGTANFWYDHLGRLVASQNAKQANLSMSEIAGTPLLDWATTKAYSYTRFDELGRPIEVGEFVQPSDLTKAIAKDPSDFQFWLFQAAPNRYRNQVTFMGYSNPTHEDALAEFGESGQGDIRNRVSSVATVQGYVPMVGIWGFPTPDYLNHYAYDVHGNVQTHLQEVTDLIDDGRRFFRTDYDYDLLTGIPHYSHFQKGKVDQFSHKYEYDADNRLKTVFTSKDGHIWDRDGEYNYRLDGKLARTELGDLQVQGSDYAYTLQGWIKGMNSSVLDPLKDMGKDGATGSANNRVAQDALAFTVGYYQNDYQSIDTDASNNFLASVTATLFEEDVNNLYNGNISSVTTAMMDLEENPIDVTGATYHYDQLHRFKESHIFSANDVTELNSFVNAQRQNQSLDISGTHNLGDYEVHVDYDQNGNIQSLNRRAYQHDAVTNNMDDFSYNYPEEAINNLLGHVEDEVSGTVYDDIKDEQVTGNYEYFKNGTLKSDKDEDIAYLEWYPNGQLKRVFREEYSPSPDLYFEYNPMGVRVLKIEMPKDDSGVILPADQWNSTWYGMDANGIPIGIYQKTESEATLNRIEASIYGSKRLGLDTRKVLIENEIPSYSLDHFTEDALCGVAGSWYMNVTPSTTYSLGDADADGETDLTISNAATSNFRVVQTINTIPSETYTVNYEVVAKTVPFVYSDVFGCGIGGSSLGSLNITSAGTYSYTFTANATKSRIYWRGWGSTGNFTLDNVQVVGLGDVYELETVEEPVVYHRIIGEKMYELSDHLGNVKEVITDRKILVEDVYSLEDDFVLANSNCADPGTWFMYPVGETTYTITDVDADGSSDLVVEHPTSTNFLAFHTISTIIGETYTVSYDIVEQTIPWVKARAQRCSGGGNLGLHNASGIGSYSYTFVAATIKTNLFWAGQGSPGGKFILGNINITGPGDIYGELTSDEAVAYLPDVVSFKDYYPFGMEMPGRKGAVSGAEGYRYAFNGMEQDQEVSGSGNSYTTMFRQYDPRLGRWKSLDPLMAKYPGASPFSAYNNNPIYFVDPLGLEGEDPIPMRSSGDRETDRGIEERALSKDPYKNEQTTFKYVTTDEDGTTTTEVQYTFTVEKGKGVWKVMKLVKTEGLGFDFEVGERDFDPEPTSEKDYDPGLDPRENTTGIVSSEVYDVNISLQKQYRTFRSDPDNPDNREDIGSVAFPVRFDFVQSNLNYTDEYFLDNISIGALPSPEVIGGVDLKYGGTSYIGGGTKVTNIYITFQAGEASETFSSSFGANLSIPGVGGVSASGTRAKTLQGGSVEYRVLVQIFFTNNSYNIVRSIDFSKDVSISEESHLVPFIGVSKR